MTPTLAFFIYVLIWWIVLFTVLPLGVRRQTDGGRGQDAGAPENPRLKRKLVLTTAISAIILGLLWMLAETRVIRWHEWFDVRTARAEEEAEPLLPAEACRALVVAQAPAPDVAYEPGVDVHEKPVMEADITPPVVAMPGNFSFDITVDVARNAHLPVPAGVEITGKAGTVTYDRDKEQFFYNGVPLEGEAEASLRALCPQGR